jgi:hypothetical protein
MNELIVSESDLSLVENNALNSNQLGRLLKQTPAKYVKQRPAKGGGTWDYVTGGYVRKCLNLMFGWDWSFEIVEQMVLHGEAIVKGKLTCNSNGKTIVKMQFGNKDIMMKKGTEIPLSIGNDLKAAATDCLKKCAAEIGIAADIYNKEDFQSINVIPNQDILSQIKELFELKTGSLEREDYDIISNTIKGEIKANYTKVLNQLKAL